MITAEYTPTAELSPAIPWWVWLLCAVVLVALSWWTVLAWERSASREEPADDGEQADGEWNDWGYRP